jgi:hypothetical protein
MGYFARWHVCGQFGCTRNGGKPIVHRYVPGTLTDQQFRDEINVEVIGQVSVIVRQLSDLFTIFPF